MAGLTTSRYGLLTLGGMGLLAGLTGALVLLGVPMPAPARGLGADHGVLMTLGFLGTLISLERAVALGRGWGYLAPLLTGAGGLLQPGGHLAAGFAVVAGGLCRPMGHLAACFF